MILFKNANIYTMEDEKKIFGGILVNDGKIEDIFKGNIEGTFDDVIDLKGSNVYPGFIDGRSKVGLIEEGLGIEGNDSEEVFDSLSPHLRAIDGINIFDSSFDGALKSGITTVCAVPGDTDVISGKVAVLKTYGNDFYGRILKEECGMCVNLGDAVKGWSKGRVEMPLSFMAQIYLIRRLSVETQNYINNRDREGFNEKYEAFSAVLEGKLPLIIYANRGRDILSALNLCDEFGFNYIIQGCSDIDLIIDEIVKRKSNIMFGPYLTDNSNEELKNRNIYSLKNLKGYGKDASIVSNHPDIPSSLLLLNCAALEESGMDYLDIIKTITINPAKALNIDDRVGSLKKGKDADFVVCKNPLRIMDKIEMVVVDGKIAYRAE